MTRGRTTLRWISLGLISSLAAVFVASDSVPLTPETYEQLTKGKKVFLKFYAPWCDHCKELAPEWEAMATNLNDDTSSSLLVGEIDCSTYGDWCETEMAILGLPTLKYGDPSYGGVFLEQYADDRSTEALSQFARELVSRSLCTPTMTEGCDVEAKGQLEKFWAMSLSSVEKEIDRMEKMISDAETEFREAFDAMQMEYDEASVRHEMTKARIKKDIKLLQTLKHKSSA